jgi:predicted Zn-dependent protease
MLDWRKLILLLSRQRRLVFLLGILLALLVIGVYVWGPTLRAAYHLRSARGALERREYDRVETELTRHLSLRPDSVEGHFLLARLARRSGHLSQAREHLRACRDLRGAKEPLDLEWSLLRVQEGDLTGEVESFLRRRLDDDPDRFLILEALSQGYTKTYRLREARECLDQMLDLESDNVYALVRRGWILERLNQLDAARSDYRRAVALQPGHALARRRLAENLLGYGKHAAEAAEHFEALRQLQPEDVTAQVSLAQCWLELGKVGEARALLDELLASHPQEATALVERGKLALSEGRAEKGETWLRQALALQPSSATACYALFLCLSQQGKTAEAEQCESCLRSLEKDRKRLAVLMRQVSEKPDHVALRCEIARLFFRFGEDQEGERWLFMALQSNPHYQPAQEALAQYHQRKGNANFSAGK